MQTCCALMGAATADACLEILEREHLREPVINSILQAMQTHLQRRVGDGCTIGAVVFSNQFGLLGITRPAKEILQQWQKK